MPGTINLVKPHRPQRGIYCCYVKLPCCQTDIHVYVYIRRLTLLNFGQGSFFLQWLRADRDSILIRVPSIRQHECSIVGELSKEPHPPASQETSRKSGQRECKHQQMRRGAEKCRLLDMTAAHRDSQQLQVPSYQASQNAHMNGREGHHGEALVEQLLAAEAAEGGGVTFL